MLASKTISNVTLIVVLTFAVSTSAGSQSSKLQGKITTPDGAAIGRARVLVHWDESSAELGVANNARHTADLSLETNKRGEFSSELTPGFYDVFVSASGFSPACRKIRVKVGETETFNAALDVSDLVVKELGFEIPK